MALSLQRVRELKAHMQTGAQTLEAVSIKLSRQMSADSDDPVLQRVADIHAPVKLTPVEPTPSHAIEEGPLYISNLRSASQAPYLNWTWTFRTVITQHFRLVNLPTTTFWRICCSG